MLEFTLNAASSGPAKLCCLVTIDRHVLPPPKNVRFSFLGSNVIPEIPLPPKDKGIIALEE